MNNQREVLCRKGIIHGLAIILLIVGLNGCTGLTPKPDFFPSKGTPHTLTYVDDNTGKEVTVFKLSDSKWAVTSYGIDNVIVVEQTGNKFIGRVTKDSVYLRAGDIHITGEINGNVVICYTHLKDGKQIYYSSKLSEKANSFMCMGDHTREYKRIE